MAKSNREISKSEAVNMALSHSIHRFGENVAASRSAAEATPIAGSNGSVMAYAVTIENGGWVIVSASTDYYPILAYSDNANGAFDLEQANQSGFSVWVNEISDAIEGLSLAENYSEISSEIEREWTQYNDVLGIEPMASGVPGGNSPQAIKCRERLKALNDAYYQSGWTFTTLTNVTRIVLPSSVYETADNMNSPYEYTIVGVKEDSEHKSTGPLLSTTWNQTEGYNDFCPNKAAAGCVGVALAQIMRFHEFPTYYNWSNMPDNPYNDEIRSLLVDVGNAVYMEWGTYTDAPSGSTISKAQIGMKNYGYTTQIKAHNASIVMDEILYNKRPVFMSGIDLYYGGHAWVCDGVNYDFVSTYCYAEFLNSVTEYTNCGLSFISSPIPCGENGPSIFFSMNWGWGGDSNGWYRTANPTPFDYSADRKDLYVHP
ncbi:MAG: C10 family peptidase [Pseudoflavonifractor sp.]|nr:C10 family peptidase [Pseudoflavonifractor sp.]